MKKIVNFLLVILTVFLFTTLISCTCHEQKPVRVSRTFVTKTSPSKILIKKC